MKNDCGCGENHIGGNDSRIMHTHYPIRDDDAATDRHPVDDIEPTQGDESMERTLDAFSILLAWLLAGRGINSYASRLLVLALHLGVECGVESYEEVAQKVGTTRSNVQLQGKQLETMYGLRFKQSRRNSTRRANRRAALKGGTPG